MAAVTSCLTLDEQDILRVLEEYGPKTRTELVCWLVQACDSESTSRTMTNEIDGLVEAEWIVRDWKGQYRLCRQ